ncbi:hypothetical protein J437_LFUL013920, partial [Ladona fulva]
MGWILLLGVAVLALGSAATEYDNIPLETSSIGISRKSSPRTIYTASYGIAPGEYVLRASHHGHNAHSPIRGLGLLPREQAPPQEYLDLLRQTGVGDGDLRGKQQSVKSKVVDQQYFGIQPNAPYLASGIIPSQGLNYDQPSIISTTTFPPARQNVIVNIPTGPGYSAAVASPTPSPAITPKPEPPSGSRKVLPYSSSLSPNVARQGAGKAVPLTYSLDYDLASLHKIGGSSGKNDGSSSRSGPYYKETPGTVVRGDKELLNQLAPTPSPIPFLPSFDESSERQKSKTADDIDNAKDKIEVIKLPSPRGQRPITQEELLELIRAGYDVRPADDHISQRQPSNVQRPAVGYQRVTPQNSLLLPSSGGATAPATSAGNLPTVDPQVQVYQPSGFSQSQSEALSQPKEYLIPAPPRHKTYRTRINQAYQPPPPSAPGNDGAVTYQQALRPIPQGYTAIPTGTGATAQGTTGEGTASQDVTAHGEALPDDAFLGASGPGLEIQRTQPRRRTSRRRQNSE